MILKHVTGNQLYKNVVYYAFSILLEFSTSLYLDEEESRDRGDQIDLLHPRIIKHSPTHHTQVKQPPPENQTTPIQIEQKVVFIKVEQSQDTQEDNAHLAIPKVTASSSSETLTGIQTQHVISVCFLHKSLQIRRKLLGQ